MAKNKDSQVSAVRKTKHGTVFSVFFSLLSIVYVMPIMIVIINSFKRKAFINKFPFKIGTGKMFVGWENYVEGIKKIEFFKALDILYLLRYVLLQSSFSAHPCVRGILQEYRQNLQNYSICSACFR